MQSVHKHWKKKRKGEHTHTHHKTFKLIQGVIYNNKKLYRKRNTEKVRHISHLHQVGRIGLM